MNLLDFLEVVLFASVALWLFLIGWAVFSWVVYRKKTRKVKDDIQKIEYKKFTKKLSGFKLITWVTLWTTIFSALMTSSNYLISVQTEKENRRPWITINNPNVVLTAVGEKKKTGEPLFVEAQLENIGKTPARYDASLFALNSFPNISVQPQEIPTGILFPGQTKKISWLVSWNNDDSRINDWARDIRGPEILCVLCGIKYKIEYREMNLEKNKYFTEMESRWTSDKNGYIGTVDVTFETTGAK